MLVRLCGLIAVGVGVAGLAGAWNTPLPVDLAVSFGGVGALLTPWTDSHLHSHPHT